MSLDMKSRDADLPTRSHTCSNALETQENKINSAMMMAPSGSRNQATRFPIMDNVNPKLLTMISFL